MNGARLSLHRPLLHRLLLLFALSAGATTQALDLDGDERGLHLGDHVQRLRDPETTRTLADVIATPDAFSAPRDHPDLNFGYTHDAVWLKLPLRSVAMVESEWRIEFQYATVDRIDAWLVAGDDVVHQRSGDLLRFSERSHAHRNPVITLRLRPGEARTLYVRAHSEGSLTLSSRLWSARAFQLHSESAYAANALYFGLALALAAYNLLLFLVLRERTILLYVAFVVTFATGLVAVTGFGAQFLWPDAVRFGNRVLAIGFATSSLLAALYARAYLDTPRHAPRWNRLLMVLSGAHAGVLLVSLFGPLQLAFQLMSAGGVLNAVIVLSCGVYCAWRRVPGAKVLVLAWSALLSGAALMALRNFGILPTNFITANGMLIGSALEMLLLSFGLAARFNELKRQKVEAQAEVLAAQQQSLTALREHDLMLEQRVAERTAQLEAANARLRELALHDPLTGLANRSALDQHLSNVLHDRGEPLRLLMIDLDGFKPVNDQHGHAIGDRLLMLVARRIRACVRDSDLAARVGGDEFVVVCRRTTSDDSVRTLCERIRATVAAPLAFDGGVVQITASIGVAGAESHRDDARELLMRADRAMYQAKAAGGDCVHWAT